VWIEFLDRPVSIFVISIEVSIDVRGLFGSCFAKQSIAIGKLRQGEVGSNYVRIFGVLACEFCQIHLWIFIAKASLGPVS